MMAERRFAKSDHGAMFLKAITRIQMWVANSEEMMCVGIYGQTIHINKNTGTVIVKFSSFPEPADEILFANSFILAMFLIQFRNIRY